MGALVATHFSTESNESTVTYSQSRLSSLVGGQDATNAAAMANPLDQQSSVDIAAAVAYAANMPEQIAVTNQADSMSISLSSMAESTGTTVSRPQIVATSFKSNKDIKSYVTVEGDTVASIAEKFGVTSDSIRWSNDMTGNAVIVGKTLNIPPINGIVYVVAANDTPETLAKTYSTGADQIIAYNDAELTGLRLGDKILIPNGQRAAVVASYSSSSSSASAAYGFSASYGGNGYIPGYCTYYAASRVSIPTNWGNANTWAIRARSTPGWTVSSRPVQGAIAQTNAMSYWGHVAIVEAVSEDGSMIKFSDMNNLAGFGRVGYSDWVSASTYQNYIYR